MHPSYPKRRLLLHLLAIATTATGACGGVAIIDPEPGSGGAAASNSSATAVTSTSTGTATTSSTATGMTAVTSTTSGGSPTACEKGCAELLACTQVDDLCPGFKGASGSEQEEFYNACVSNPLCESRASIITGKECRDIIETISGLSADFKALCEGADDGDSDGNG